MVGKLQQRIDGCGINRDRKPGDVLFYYIVLSLTQVTMQHIFLLLLPFRVYLFSSAIFFPHCTRVTCATVQHVYRKHPWRLGKEWSFLFGRRKVRLTRHERYCYSFTMRAGTVAKNAFVTSVCPSHASVRLPLDSFGVKFDTGGVSWKSVEKIQIRLKSGENYRGLSLKTWVRLIVTGGNIDCDKNALYGLNGIRLTEEV